MRAGLYAGIVSCQLYAVCLEEIASSFGVMDRRWAAYPWLCGFPQYGDDVRPPPLLLASFLESMWFQMHHTIPATLVAGQIRNFTCPDTSVAFRAALFMVCVRFGWCLPAWIGLDWVRLCWVGLGARRIESSPVPSMLSNIREWSGPTLAHFPMISRSSSAHGKERPG